MAQGFKNMKEPDKGNKALPGKEPGGVTETTESPILGRLKAHKSLPRRTPGVDKVAAMTSREPKPSLGCSKDPSAYTTSQEIRSWIPEPSPIHIYPVASEPLTPPINIKDNFKSWIDDAAMRDRAVSKQHSGSSCTTPLVQQSPPTPDLTPPKKTHIVSAFTALSSSRKASNNRSGSSRNASDSRTESFITARENNSSDDESHQADSPSLHPSRENWLRATGLHKHRDVGLGLGLGSEDDASTVENMTLKHLTNRTDEFVMFNGIWSGTDPDGTSDHESQATARREPRRLKYHQLSHVVDCPRQDSATLGPDAEPPLLKSPNLRHGVGQNHQTPSVSTERFANAKENKSPMQDDIHNLEAEIREVNEKRLSQASTTSTIVEAMVYDNPPRRQQTLRHTGKLIGMDTSSYPQYRLYCQSVVSNDHSYRRRTRNVTSPDQGLRSSFASDTQEPASENPVLTLQGAVPVIFIPDHRSSIQSSAPSSKRLSRTFSLNSRQQSSRPTTAPEEAVGYFDIPRRDRRTVSVVIQQATPLRAEKKIEKEPSTPVLTVNTPPAGSISRELSRTRSLTSSGAITFYNPRTPSNQTQPASQVADSQESQSWGLDRSSTGDWSAFRPRSALVTPFSLRSAQSSTPGTLEVNEATAISIYPHTNKSILVIQQMADRDDALPREQSALVAKNANIALPDPVTPVMLPSLPPRQITNSPLKNPRDPPQPPKFIEIIPPTPANARTSSEHAHNVFNIPTRPNRRNNPFSSLKRALSARRSSEPFVSSFTRTRSLRGSVVRQRPIKADDEDSKLHPLWRPRGFWNDAGESDSDSDSEFGNDGILSSEGFRGKARPTKRTMSLTNRITGSLRMHSSRQPRRASIASWSGPPYDNAHAISNGATTGMESPSLRRRIGGSLRLPSSRLPRRSTTASWANQPNYEFVTKDESADNMPRQGYQVQFVGFRGLAEKLERRREMKEEGKREARRSWLRGRIDLVGPEDPRTVNFLAHGPPAEHGGRVGVEDYAMQTA